MEYKFSVERCLTRYLAPVLIVQLIGGLLAAYIIKLGFAPINGLSDLQCAIIAIAAIVCVLVTPFFLIVTIIIEVLLFKFAKDCRLTEKDGTLIYDELSDGVIQGQHNAKKVSKVKVPIVFKGMENIKR